VVTEEPASQHQERAASRSAVSIRAQVRIMGTDKLDIDVTDLSRTGFQVETIYRIQPGATIWLKIPNMAGLEATVKWNRRHSYGCAFVRPLHEAVFDHIVALAAPKRSVAAR
jgi:hypothetical protein